MSDRQRRMAQESLQPTSKHDQLLGKLREIGIGPGELDGRVEAAKATVQGERDRFPASDAGRIQWNWYMGKFATEIRYERDRLELSSRKPTRPGETAPGPLLEFFTSLQPHILNLRESGDEPVLLGAEAEARQTAKKR
jgi:hypothetical protein